MRGVLALSALTSLSATGCIVADAPDYGSPQRSPIFMYHPIPTNPASVQALRSTETTPVQFGATVKSEDAGEQIVAIFFVDYKQKNERLLDSLFLPPLTFEQERPINHFSLISREFPAQTNTCHSITLLVTHYSSWDQVTKTFIGPEEDKAMQTWFVTIDDDQSTLVSKCPSALTGQN